MDSWEYCEISFYKGEQVISGGDLIVYGKEDRTYIDYAGIRNEIARLGQEGWELVSVGADSQRITTFYFKRKMGK